MIEINRLKFHYPSGDFQLAIPDFSILKGEKVARDTPKTSLLAAIIEVMADYVADPIGKELYKPLFEKLDFTENFDWEPFDR